jgi:hypothetical protein
VQSTPCDDTLAKKVNEYMQAGSQFLQTYNEDEDPQAKYILYDIKKDI